MENRSSLETTRNNVENETSWVDQVDEEDLKNMIMHFPKNDPPKFAENVGWIQVGKKGKSFSPRNTRIHSIPKQKYKENGM